MSGIVVERLEDSPYCFLRVKTEADEVWAAVPNVEVKKGWRVTVSHGAALKSFVAPRLRRRFDRVVFGTMEVVSRED